MRIGYQNSANLENALRHTHLRWAAIFAEKAYRLLDAILDYSGIDPDLMELFDVYQSQALDPNVYYSASVIWNSI